MSVEQLLKPRRKVIADYPGSPFKIGDILYWHNTGQTGTGGNDGFYSLSSHYEISVTLYPAGQIENYPHLFKPLQWWEEREASEWPEYVKEESGKIHKVIRMDGNRMVLGNDEEWSVVSNVMCFFEPATLAEYTDYLTQINKK